MSNAVNTRVLLVDDMESIHEDFRKILGASRSASLSAIESELLGLPRQEFLDFELHSAYQGIEAVAQVRSALAAGRPFSLAFVDMRMPPGWDGMETVERLWELDPRLQVVICTAYSDHAWDDLLARLDARDRLVILKKPFDVIEVSQLARALTAKWSHARDSERHASEREELVQRLQESERQLQATAQELRAFAHTVSHDLQTPLALIGSFSRLIEDQLVEREPRVLQYLQFIRGNAERGRQLVSGLLTLNQVCRAELRLQQVDLGSIVGTLVTEMRAAAPERKVEPVVPQGLVAWVDPELIQVVLANLVGNAWKFSAGRNPATIELGTAPGGEGEAVFFVRDNGCGFDMADAAGMFHSFHRLHSQDEYPGTGMGLVTVRRVLARHGGRVWAESRPGQGSTFFFALPTAPEAPSPVAELAARLE